MSSPLSYVPKTSHYAHQKMVLEKCWDREAYGLLLEMGTGKTKICIDNICALRESHGLECALIIAPKGTYDIWTDAQIPAHMPDRHRLSAVIHLWKGVGGQEDRRIQSVLTKGSHLRILVMNVEALSMSTKALAIAERFVKSGNCMIVVDESSTIKNPQATRTKKLIKLRRSAKWRRIATGTPISRGPLDIWSQFEFLNQNCLGFSSFISFRSRFAITETEYFGKSKVEIVRDYRDIEYLSELVSKHAAVLKKEDCIDLPPKMYREIEVPLTEEQQRLYNELRDWATAQLDSGEFLIATKAVVLLLRLHQIVCGHATDETGKSFDVPTNRLNVLEGIVSETSSSNIVWCQYRRDVDLVMDRLRSMGRQPVRYDGSTSQDDRREAVYRFQGYGSRLIDGRSTGITTCPDSQRATDFVGTPHAGGYGLTLTAANTVIYYSNGWDLEKRLQSEDRPHRIGQNSAVLYIDLVSRGTVEEAMIASIRRKLGFLNMIMDGPARIRDVMRGIIP